MSMAALLLGMRDVMRTGLSLPAAQCGVMPKGKPPAVAGQIFYAIHDGNEQQLDDESMEEILAAKVTISMRGGALPYDRWGVELVCKAVEGLLPRGRAVAALLHMNESLRAAVNVIIGAGENGITETIRYKGRTTVAEQYADWWHGERKGVAPDGVSLELTFGDAKRYQVIEEQS